MSATTEQILEQINELKEAIASADAIGHDSSMLKTTLESLSKKLVSAAQAINESKQLLKG